MRIAILLSLLVSGSASAGGARVVVTVAPEQRPTPADQEALTVYQSRCVVCHGSTGAGDGVAAMGMDPKPRAFADPDWQKSVADTKLLEAIVRGGAAVGMSPLMPANADLKPAVAEALVRLIRGQRSAKVVADLKPPEGEGREFRGVMQMGHTFTIEGVPPGAYTLSGFLDVDGDGKRGKGEAAFEQKVDVTEKGAAVTVARAK